jgi:hypothetical protein
MRIEKKEEKKEVIEILGDVRIPGTDIILEKGDKIEVFEAKKKKKDEEGDEEEADEEDSEEDEEEVEEKKKKK